MRSSSAPPDHPEPAAAEPRTQPVEDVVAGAPARWPSTVLGAGAGLTAAAVALGVAELVAGLRAGWRSPVLDVGDRVIDRVPSWLKELAIDWFGTADKLALLVGIGVVLGALALAVGVCSVRRGLRWGITGIVATASVGAIAATHRRAGGGLDAVVPAVAGGAAGVVALWLIQRRLAAIDEVAAVGRDGTAAIRTTTRREAIGRVAVLSCGLLSVAAGSAALGRALGGRFGAAASRSALRLPSADRRAPAVPDAVSVDVDGVAPFFTPNADFYRIDTALTVPQVPTDGYELRVTGSVDRELRLSYDDLLARRLEEHDITLTCVSNTVGGELVGTARWLGVRLDDLLAEAGIDPSADQVIGRSIDGYTCGFPVEAATDGRHALVAVGMNGEPLPLEHGFPARLVVPGLYGYVSATKWLTEIVLTRFDREQQYWVPRGYAERAPIELMSRIDSVDGLDTLRRQRDGSVAIGGVAWAQTRGVAAVEVQIDDRPWAPAALGVALNDDTWRQWAFRWTPDHDGRTSIRCRATDANGVIQTDERAEPLPDGASGHHQIVVFVE